MATNLALRNSQNASPNVDLTVLGVDTALDMVTTFGASALGAGTNTVASGTEIILTNVAGGATLCWISGRAPAGGFTLTSTFLSCWFHESNMNANCGMRFRVFRYRPGSPPVLTELGGGPFNDGVEFGTAGAEFTFTGNVTDLAFLEDDRVVVKVFLTNVGTMGGGFTCTMTYDAASASTGDSLFQIAETVGFKAESGPAAEFAASVSGTASASGALTTAIELVGSVQAAGAVAGALTTAIQLAVSATGTASASAVLSTEIRLAAAATGNAAAAGDLTAPQQALFAAAVSGSASAAGALTTAIECTAAVSASASAIGALSTEIRFGAAAQATATAGGELTTAIQFAGACVGTGTASAGLTTAITLNGSIVAPAAAVGDLTVSASFDAAVTATATVGGNLTTVIQFGGNVTGVAAAAGELFTAISFEGAAFGEVLATAVLTAGPLGEPFGELTVHDIGDAGLTPQFVPAAFLMQFSNDGRVYLHVRNDGAAPMTVSMRTIAPTSDRVTFEVPVPAGGERLFGPFIAARFGTRPLVTYSDVTGVLVQARRIPRFGVNQHLKGLH